VPTPESVVPWHQLQQSPNGCVPTCFAMVARRLGVTFDDASYAADSRKGFDLFAFEPPFVSRARVLDLDQDGLRQLRALLAIPAWVIVCVNGPRWVRALGPRVHPQFGPLCAAGDGGAPFHAIVVVGVVGARFGVLDPWVPADQQTGWVDSKTLAHCGNGRARWVEVPSAQ
jgi:hypothetical protein